MSNEMKAALIGLAGALIGAIVTYIATMRSTRKQLTAQRRQAERDRIGREQEPIVLFMADFLTEYTAEEARREHEILRELDHQLERLVKSLQMKGQPELVTRFQGKDETTLWL